MTRLGGVCFYRLDIPLSSQKNLFDGECYDRTNDHDDTPSLICFKLCDTFLLGRVLHITGNTAALSNPQS